MMDLALLLSLAVTLGLALMVLAAALSAALSVHERQRRIRERFAAERDAEPPARTVSLVRRPQAGPGGLGGWMRQMDPAAAAGLFLRSLSLRQILLFVLVAAAAGIGLVGAAGADPRLGLGAGVAAGTVAVLLLRRHQRQRRVEEIAEQVPEALEMIVRGLKVGIPVNRALAAAGAELTGPLADEFALAAQEISYGKDTAGALREMALRCENRELGFLATAVSIQQHAGGNLAEVLSRLAAITRGRHALRRKVAAITAEAKWSGRFLSAFPLAAAAALLAINPNYFAEVSGQGFFRPLMAVVGVLLVANIFFMRAMVDIKP